MQALRRFQHENSAGNCAWRAQLVVDAPMPELLPGEAEVEPVMAALTTLDAEVARGLVVGGREPEPMTLGHLFVGRVVRTQGDESRPDLAAKAKQLKDQLVVGSLEVVRQPDDLVRRGLAQHARDRKTLGINGRDGVLAERFALPLSNLLVVPAGVEGGVAVWAHAVASALHAVQMVDVSRAKYVTVLGDGLMGLLCAQLAHQRNEATRIIGKHEERLEHAARWGIKHRLIGETGLRTDQGVVIDCTGSWAGLETALGMVEPRGTVVTKTMTAESANIDLTPATLNEVQLLGSRWGTLGEGLDVLERGAVDVTPFVHDRVGLEGTLGALDRIMSGQSLTTVVEMR